MNRAGATGEWQAMLPMGALGQEKAYLAQFAWPLSSRAGSASGSCSYGQPFLIRLQATAAGIVPSVEGLADISPEPQAPIANQGMGGPLNAMRPGVPPTSSSAKAVFSGRAIKTNT